MNKYSYQNCINRSNILLLQKPLKYKSEKFAKLGYKVFNIEKTGDYLRDGEKTIEEYINFYRSINMPTKLSDVNIHLQESDIEYLSESASFHSTRTIGDIKALDKNDIKNIYRMMN